MNIPLNNLYHWIRGLAYEPVSIYTFRPHGSKNIVDLGQFGPHDYNPIFPEIVCHDQEPLDYNTCQKNHVVDAWHTITKLNSKLNTNDSEEIVNALSNYYGDLNFLAIIRRYNFRGIFDKYVLLHSEKNSIDVEKFGQHAETVYYWCHGIIARDWYRFAEQDTRLQMPSSHTKTFLIYCRAWTGTREYRLKFLDLLADKNLLGHCQTSILKQDQQFNLDSYVCADTNFQPSNLKLLNQIADNNQPAAASADYCADDFVSTDISIVLETVAADTKIHLTEKTLRPIACGHPFILVAGPGALEYLKSYGFKTFAPWIDESYDQEQDIVKRMEKIAEEMKRIENLNQKEKKHMLEQLEKITIHNKTRFFSNSFFNQIQSELEKNLNQAISRVKATRGKHYFAKNLIIKKKYSNPDPIIRKQKVVIAKILRQLRRDPSVSIKQIVSQYPDEFFNSW
jgi:hypothetical protein